MKTIDITDSEHWYPLQPFGITHSFFSLNATTISATWLAIGILLIIAIILRYFLHKQSGTGNFIVTSLMQSSMQFVSQALGAFSATHFYFIGSLFTFILFCNFLGVVPLAEEATKDINTTLALGTISFIYTQVWTIKTHGAIAYIKDFFSPFFIMLPLNIIGKLANIVSISFRLFGNIFGGSIIMQILEGFLQTHVLLETAALISGLNLIVYIFFGVFESFLQAFVFAMLSVTYLAIGIQKEEATLYNK